MRFFIRYKKKGEIPYPSETRFSERGADIVRKHSV